MGDVGVSVAGGRWRGLVAASLLVTATACSSSVPLSPPTGVDELVVPTPSPRPADFVAVIDNPWLAWTPGRVTTYDETGGQVTVTVAARTTPLAGLAATVVTTAVPGSPDVVDYYAQDRAGNVWWLGRRGEWTEGLAGAEAGLWMPAAPRQGDGFRQGLARGVVDDVATVLLAPAADAGPAPDPETRLEVTSTLEPGTLVVRTYVEGSGLVRELRSGAGAYLRSVDTGA